MLNRLRAHIIFASYAYFSFIYMYSIHFSSYDFKIIQIALARAPALSLSLPAYVLVIHINCSHSFEWVNYSAHFASIVHLSVGYCCRCCYCCGSFLACHSPPLLVAGAAVAYLCLSICRGGLHTCTVPTDRTFFLLTCFVVVFFLLVLHCIYSVCVRASARTLYSLPVHSSRHTLLPSLGKYSFNSVPTTAHINSVICAGHICFVLFLRCLRMRCRIARIHTHTQIRLISLLVRYASIAVCRARSQQKSMCAS